MNSEGTKVISILNLAEPASQGGKNSGHGNFACFSDDDQTYLTSAYTLRHRPLSRE